jgi:hypothetical protein
LNQRERAPIERDAGALISYLPQTPLEISHSVAHAEEGYWLAPNGSGFVGGRARYRGANDRDIRHIKRDRQILCRNGQPDTITQQDDKRTLFKCVIERVKSRNQRLDE